MRRSLLLWPLLCGLALPGLARGGAKWTQPTPAELQMTSDAASPGADAVYLYLEETADDQQHEHTYYARIKILTEEGRKYADVTMPYWNKEEKIRGIEGRTIHSDGTVVPFTGKPWQKELVKAGGVRIMEKGFSLPDVQVGSIVEYRYATTYDGLWAPQWYLQQPLFVHQAHFHFLPGAGGNYAMVRFLPKDAQVKDSMWKGWDLLLHDLPAQVDEVDSPPPHSIGYRVLFYYVGENIRTPDDFWQGQGRFWSAGVDGFAAPDKLKPVVAQIVAPGDTDEQKLKKIYAAVMKLENTDFTRERTEAENKAQNVRVNDAADIWAQQRGNEPEIALLFLGLTRAAGLKAYAMKVVNRDENTFLLGHLDWGQLDDTIAIVNVGGKEIYLDPGERYCEFGKLRWQHSWTGGVRQTDNGVAIGKTPPPAFQDNDTKRHAELRLDATGQVQGSIEVQMSGGEALHWRQEALLTDEEQAKTEFRDDLKAVLPAGLTVTMTGFTGLTDVTAPLTATLSVSGPLGTRTGHRLFLPGSFFEAQAKPRFANATREYPIYLPYAYLLRDDVTISLPPGETAELLPKDAQLSYSNTFALVERYRWSGTGYRYVRLEQVATPYVDEKDYAALRDYFQKMNTQDQAQLVLETTPATTRAAP